MRVAFVTGTDTGVGKTIVSAAIAAILRSRDRRCVRQAGPDWLAAGEPGDADDVRRLAGPLETLEGVRLPDPLAPDRASSLAGVALPTLFEQRDLVLGAAASHDTVLVEGAGGVNGEPRDGVHPARPRESGTVRAARTPRFTSSLGPDWAR